MRANVKFTTQQRREICLKQAIMDFAGQALIIDDIDDNPVLRDGVFTYDFTIRYFYQGYLDSDEFICTYGPDLVFDKETGQPIGFDHQNYVLWAN